MEPNKFYSVFGPDGSQIGTVAVSEADDMDADRLKVLLDEQGDDDHTVAETPAGDEPTLTVRDRKSTRLNSSHITRSRMPSSA